MHKSLLHNQHKNLNHFRKSKTYSTRRQDLEKRLSTCKQILSNFISTSKDKARVEKAERLLKVFDWYAYISKGALSGEIMFNYICLTNESSFRLTPLWYDLFRKHLNKYSLDSKALEVLMRGAIRGEQALLQQI